MTVRHDGTVSPGDAAEQISAFLEAMDSQVYATQFIRFESAAEGSNVRVPQSWGGLTEWGSNAGDDTNTPQFWSFTGKSTDGRRFRLELFGRQAVTSDNYRVYAVDSTAIQDAIAALETTEPVFLTISGASPIFNQYANESMSQHWIGEMRK